MELSALSHRTVAVPLARRPIVHETRLLHLWRGPRSVLTVLASRHVAQVLLDRDTTPEDRRAVVAAVERAGSACSLRDELTSMLGVRRVLTVAEAGRGG